MEYHGKLFGRIGVNQYFYTGKTSDDWDKMEMKIQQLEAVVRTLKSMMKGSSGITLITHSAVCDKCGNELDAGLFCPNCE